jgi:hypothetical protein
MPDTSDQSRMKVPLGELATRLLNSSAEALERTETAMTRSFARGFDGHKKLVAVLRQLDEEIALAIREERGL